MFDRLTNGFLLAIASAALIESLQNLVVGHHFSVFELAGKAILISAGFALGLFARHDRAISIGPLHVRLIS